MWNMIFLQLGTICADLWCHLTNILKISRFVISFDKYFEISTLTAQVCRLKWLLTNDHGVSEVSDLCNLFLAWEKLSIHTGCLDKFFPSKKLIWEFIMFKCDIIMPFNLNHQSHVIDLITFYLQTKDFWIYF